MPWGFSLQGKEYVMVTWWLHDIIPQQKLKFGLVQKLDSGLVSCMDWTMDWNLDLVSDWKARKVPNDDFFQLDYVLVVCTCRRKLIGSLLAAMWAGELENKLLLCE